MKRDYLAWAALLFALIATASAEYELARAVGFNQWVAAAVPGALDVYTVRAMRARKDVLAVVLAMIGVNAASHLVSSGLLPVSIPLVVAVSAIAPLVLWRVHRLAEHDDQTPAVPVPETGAEQPGTPVPAPRVETAIQPPSGTPTGTAAGYALAAGQDRYEVRAEYIPEDGDEYEETGVPDPAEAVFVEGADELTMDAAADFANLITEGAYPSIRQLRDTYSIGQVRATRIQKALQALAEMGGEDK